jgi:hypothetical protein
VLVSDILFSNAESLLLYGRLFLRDDDASSAKAAGVPVPAAMAPQQVEALFTARDPAPALADWLGQDPQRLHWTHPQTGQGLLHLAAACQNVALVQLLLDKGIDPRHPDSNGQTAEQLLPPSYSSSHTDAAENIARMLRR